MFLRLLIANIKMIYRNRQALFWALVFPLIFVVVFGLFRLDRPPVITVAVLDQSQDRFSAALVQGLEGITRFEIEVEADERAARQKLADGDFRYLLVIPEGLAARAAQGAGGPPVELTLVYDQGQPSAGLVISAIRRFVDRTNLEVARASPVLQVEEEPAVAKRLSYFDFVLPGFVGMGVMSYAVIGVAVTITRYREAQILKRVLITPLKVRTFFAANILAYLILSLVQAMIILGAGILLFGGRVYGNYLWILALVAVGNLIFLNIGFVVGSVSRNIMAASGLANAITIPMMFFSGVFFPKDNLPGVLAKVVEYLPLTPLLDALRGVALEGKAFWVYPAELGMLGAWIVATSVVAVRTLKLN